MDITISMKAYIQNLEKVCLTKHLDDELSARESHEFRGINGCWQWVTMKLLYPFSVRCESAPTKARTGPDARIAQSRSSIDEITRHEEFTLTYRVLDLTSCGLIGAISLENSVCGIRTRANTDFRGSDRVVASSDDHEIRLDVD